MVKCNIGKQIYKHSRVSWQIFLPSGYCRFALSSNVKTVNEIESLSSVNTPQARVVDPTTLNHKYQFSNVLSKSEGQHLVSKESLKNRKWNQKARRNWQRDWNKLR